jgi:hypothetical protein
MLGAQKTLEIAVLEGDGAFNDIKRGIARTPVVEVRDDIGHVVAGAKVVFQLPDMQAGGTFADGTRTLITSTDNQGRASATGLKPNKVEGRFSILVTASSEGRTGQAQVMQTNTLAGGDQSMSSGHGKLKGILVAVAGIATAGVIAAVRSGGSKGSSTPAPTPTTLSAGTVTIGGPR